MHALTYLSPGQLVDAKLACVAEHESLCDTPMHTQLLLKAAARLRMIDGSKLSDQAARVNVPCLHKILSTKADATKVGKDCRTAIKVWRGGLAINPLLDDAMMEECKETIATEAFTTYCTSVFPKASKPFAPLQAMQCLRRLRSIGRLQEHCSMQVARVQRDEAVDMTLDARLYAACEVESKDGPCSEHKTGEGALRSCLEGEMRIQKMRHSEYRSHHCPGHEAECAVPANLTTVSNGCGRLLIESTLVRADSIELHPGLEAACSHDRQRLCASVKPGGGALMACLAAHSEDGEIAAACKAKLHGLKQQMAGDFRLNVKLSAACSTDILTFCKNVKVGSGRVNTCLLEHEEKLESADCKAEVSRMGRTVTSDIEYNQPIYHACVTHVRDGSICGRDTLGVPPMPALPPGTQPVRGRVLACLKANLTQITRLELERMATGDAAPNGTNPNACEDGVRKLMVVQARDVTYNFNLVRVCAYEMKAPEFCGTLDHGSGVVISCLVEKRDLHGFSHKCRHAVEVEYESHTSDIELMVAMKKACKADLKITCGYNQTWLNAKPDIANTVEDNTRYREHAGSYVNCLRATPLKELSSASCRNYVHTLQLAASENIRLNPQVDSACRAEQARYCRGEKWKGPGLKIACLEEAKANNSTPLGDKCEEMVLRHQQLSMRHIESNWPVVKACTKEMNTYCSAELEAQVGAMPQVERGSKLFKGSRARVTKPKELTVLACLQANALNPAFGGRCKAMIAEKTKAQLSDMRADMDLFSACREYTVKNCDEQWRRHLPPGAYDAHEGYSAALIETPSRRLMGVVYECVSDALYQTHGELGKGFEGCTKELLRVERLQAQFPAAATSVNADCTAEFHQLCGTNASHDAIDDRGLLACLRTSERFIKSDKCRARAKAMERLAHRELAHNAEVVSACHDELTLHCAAPTSEGGGLTLMGGGSMRAGSDQMACLDRYSRVTGAHAMSDGCKEVLFAYQIRRTESLDLMEEVRKPCAQDYANLCEGASAQDHASAAVQCLKDNRDVLESEKCHDAITTLMGRSSADARFDPLLRQLCAAEIAGCKQQGVQPGEGRINECLRSKMKEHQLAAACKQQVFKTQQAELGDVRLSYPIQQHCRVELVRFCAQVRPGEARRLACLEAHQGHRDFSKPCHITLGRVVRESVNDYRLLPRLRSLCAAPIRTLCEGVTAGDSQVIVCLLEKECEGRLSKECGLEVRGAARSAFLNFGWSQGITQVCDPDVWGECAGEGGIQRLGRPPTTQTVDGAGDTGSAVGGASVPAELRSADSNNDGIFSGDEVWSCISRAAHSEETEFFAPQCKQLVLTLAPHRIDSPDEAVAMATELSEQHVALSKRHAALETKHKHEKERHSQTSAQKSRVENELVQLETKMKAKETDLARLREQLMFQQEVEEKARKLKEAYDEQRALGIFISWKLVAPLAAIGLVATLYLSSRINAPQRKGYEQVFVPKDS